LKLLTFDLGLVGLV
jgi:hypothetical protein